MILAKHHRSVIAILVLFTAPSHSQLQDLRFERITAEEGLSNNSVNCILQDRQGFMWFGTNDGLNRYDGYAFRVFRNDPSDLTSLSSNAVSCIAEDSFGFIWVGTDNGLNKYDQETEQFARYLKEEGDPKSISDNGVNAIFQDSAGELWIATGYGLNRYDRGTDQWSRFFFEGQVDSVMFYWNNNRITAISEDHNGLLLVGTTDDFLRFNPLTGATSIIPDYNPYHPQGDWWPVMSCIYRDRLGKYWIGLLLDGVAVFESETGKSRLYAHDPLDPYSYSADFSHSIYEDRGGLLWIASNDGLNVFDRKKERFTVFRHSGRNEHSISSNAILCVYGDKQENIWIGTDTGINKLARWEKPFKHYVHDSEDPGGLASGEVLGICAARDGTIWTASYGGGISRLNVEGHNLTHYKNKPSLSLGNGNFDMVWGICEDRFGYIWASYISINCVNTRTGETRHYEHERLNPESHSGIWTPTIYEDREGTLWFGTSGGGLERFNRVKETFTHYKYEVLDPQSLASDDVCAIYQDELGFLWIGTGRGLCKMVWDEKGKGRFIRYLADASNPNSLSGFIVYSIYEDRKKRFWIGTDQGLNQMDRGNERFTVLSEKDGMPSNDVYAILEDDHGNLWLRTKRGLVKFSPDARSFRTYDERDGLMYCKSIGMGYQAFCKGKSGEFYYGGANSIAVFHPDSLKDNPNVPTIRLTGFRLFNTPVPIGHGSPLKRSITATTEIQLSHDQNNVSFEFAALDFTAPSKNQHAYMMEGVDKDWVYSGNQHSATYSSLSPDEYVFRVKGSNNDGVWNEGGTSIAIVIHPPWWKTTWANLLYGLAVASILYAAHRTRLNRQRLKHQLELEHLEAEKLKEVGQVKSRFFSNVSHEFRTPLTLILGPIEKMLGDSTEPRSDDALMMVRRNAQKLLGLVNQLLDLSKVEAGTMRLRVCLGDVVPFVRRLVQSFQSWAERKKITLGYDCDIEHLHGYFDPEHAEKILNNLISNALKFTPEGGKVVVQISNPKSQIPRHVEISVSDTGIGIPSEKIPHVFDRFYRVDESHKVEGAGIGLALVKELVDLHHGTISVESKVGVGTEFILTLPIGKDSYVPEEIAVGAVSEKDSEIAIRPIPSVDHAELAPPVAEQQASIVLVVEDNDDVRAYLRGYLINDYAVLEARDGMEGLEKASVAIPDLVVCDVMMPRMDGYELCRALKGDERTSHVPVILLTARAATESKIEGLATGADDYLTKPFEAQELLSRISNLIEGRRLLREKWSKTVTLKPGEVAVTSLDDAFLRRVMASVEANMGREDYGVDDLAHDACLSRSQLHRKLVALTNLSPAEFTRRIRLLRAKELLEKNAGTVAEVAERVGFSDASHFAHAFQKQFGILPSDARRAGANSAKD